MNDGIICSKMKPRFSHALRIVLSVSNEKTPEGRSGVESGGVAPPKRAKKAS